MAKRINGCDARGFDRVACSLEMKWLLLAPENITQLDLYSGGCL